VAERAAHSTPPVRHHPDVPRGGADYAERLKEEKLIFI
jgi:hypothetical protein